MEDLSEPAGQRAELWRLDPRRELGERAHALLDELARSEEVRVLLEDSRDAAQPVAGDAALRREPRKPAEGDLDGSRHQPLDFFGRVAWSAGEDHHLGAGDVRQGVESKVTGLPERGGGQRHDESQHGPSVVDGRS